MQITTEQRNCLKTYLIDLNRIIYISFRHLENVYIISPFWIFFHKTNIFKTLCNNAKEINHMYINLLYTLLDDKTHEMLNIVNLYLNE